MRPFQHYITILSFVTTVIFLVICPVTMLDEARYKDLSRVARAAGTTARIATSDNGASLSISNDSV
jgi:hypothetical protein